MIKLLYQIIADLLDDSSSVGSALLKLRFLASRLESEPLEDWVQHEIEGYEKDRAVPDYRRVGVIYRGTLTDGHRVMSDIPIPIHLV